MNEQFHTRKFLYLGVFQVVKEEEVVPYVMVLFLMLLKAILFSVEYLNIHAANVALRFLVFIPFFSLLTYLSELIDDNGSQHLLNDDLDDEEIHKVEQYIENIIRDKVGCEGVGIVVDPYHPEVGF